MRKRGTIGGALLAFAMLAAALTAVPAFAAFPGKPGPIAYSMEIFDAGAQTGGLFAHGPRIHQNSRQLTFDPGDHSPAYSANGRLIAFVSYDEGTARRQIYVARADGSGRRLVTTDGLGGADPAFFPGGGAIVFSRGVAGRRQIFSIRIDGSNLRQLTRGPHENYDPAVSPNGRRIAFATTRDRDGGNDRSDIFTMRRDGRRVRPAIAGPRGERQPDWSPNGRRIVYVVGGGPTSDLLVARANGRRRLLLTPCEGIRCRTFSDPAFSPNGRHVVALSKSTRTSGIEVFRSDGRGTYRTFVDAHFDEDRRSTFVGAPTWGPRPR